MKSQNSIKPSLRRVLIVNSGRFSYCDLDLNQSTHLHGGNNAGKTTIVNALQFAFIDNFQSMVWDQHTLEDTRKHYFDQFSSIVFEVSTPGGPQCLAVIGMGPGKAYEFERWRYNGTLEPESFVLTEGNTVRPRELHEIKHYFAEMEAVKMRASDIQKWVTGRGDSPFSVAPLKRARDYPKFRQLFTNLLRLKRIKSNEIRGLLVACSDVIAPSINLREKYKQRYDEFAGKQAEIRLLYDARDRLEECITIHTNLVSRRTNYSQCYNFVRDYTETEVRRLSELKAGLQVDLEAAESNIAELKDGRDQAKIAGGEVRDRHTRLQPKTDELKKKIDKALSFSEIELVTELTSVSESVKQLNAGLVRSTEGDLDRSLSRVIRKIASLESEIAGKRSLQRAVRDLANSDELPLAIWSKILDEQLMELIEGDRYSVQAESDLRAFLSSLDALLDGETLNIAGTILDLSGIEPAPTIESSEDLQSLVNQTQIRLEQIQQAITARDENERIRKELKTAQERERELIEFLDLLRVLDEMQKELEKQHLEIEELGKDLKQYQNKETELQELIEKHIKETAEKKAESERHGLAIEEIGDAVRGLHPPSDEWATSSKTPVEGETWKEIIKRITSQNRKLKSTEAEFSQVLVDVHRMTEGRFHRGLTSETIVAMQEELDALEEKKKAITLLQESLSSGLKNDIRDFMTSFDAIKKLITKVNRSFKTVQISDLDWFKLELNPSDSGILQAMERIRAENTLLAFTPSNEEIKTLDILFDRGQISLEEVFDVHVQVSIDGKVKRYRDMHRFESQGTSVAVKICFHVEILHNMLKENRGHLPIFLDELDRLDDSNIKGIVQYCEDMGFRIITASPRPKTILPVNYWLDRSGFVVDRHRSEWSGTVE